MQYLQQPRLIHETEDVHLIETFLFSTKMNEANFRVSQQLGHKLAQDAIGKDFYAIPDRIFKPLDEGRGGHTNIGTKEQEYEEIRNNSLGKIVSVSGPHYFEDNSGDYWYDAKIKLNGSKTASILIENGKNTFPPFSVSQHIWSLDGSDDNITDAEFMGLALVITGAEGDQAVVKKYCTGGQVNCQKSLAAAVLDVINSYKPKQPNSIYMSTQTVQEIPNVTKIEQPVQQPVTEEKKDITLTKEEYDTLQKQLKEQEALRSEVTALRNEYKTNILNQVFSDIEDQNTKDNLIKKYFEKDEKLVKELFEDFSANILPKKIDEAVKKAKEEKPQETINKSKTASSLKPEPKKNDSEESKVASIEEPSLSQQLKEIGL